MHGLGPRPARYIGINIISWELLLSSRCKYSEFNLKTSKQLKAKVVRAVTDQWPTNNSKAFKSTFVTIISFVTIIITRNPNHHHQDQHQPLPSIVVAFQHAAKLTGPSPLRSTSSSSSTELQKNPQLFIRHWVTIPLIITFKFPSTNASIIIIFSTNTIAICNSRISRLPAHQHTLRNAFKIGTKYR